MKEVNEVLRKEIVCPVIHETFAAGSLCVAPLLVLVELY